MDAATTHEAPVLSISTFSDYTVIGDMAGNLLLMASSDGNVLDRRKEHRKYVVKIAVSEQEQGTWIASAGWDSKVYIYWLPKTRSPPSLQEPVGEISLSSNPEAILFVHSSFTDRTNLLLSRRDSTFLYYYDVPNTGSFSTSSTSIELELLGRQNLAPHALSWVAFTPSEITLCPTDGTKVAIATSSTPHMKLLVVRLLFPNGIVTSYGSSLLPTNPTASVVATAMLDASEGITNDSPSSTAAAARADLAQQNREEAAILISCNTMAPQTQYSTPVVVWRPDGSGLFVNGDDGIVRGIEASTGKVVCKLESHEPGSKIRCLWAGTILSKGGNEEKDVEEWLVSGGFDQRLIVWR